MLLPSNFCGGDIAPKPFVLDPSDPFGLKPKSTTPLNCFEPIYAKPWPSISGRFGGYDPLEPPPFGKVFISI